MAEGVLGVVNWVGEPTTAGAQGEQSLMPLTAVAGTMSLIVAPSGSTGMRLRFKVLNNTATGTITTTGKDINGNAITETIPPTGVIPIPPPSAQNPYVGAYEYTSMLVYGSGTTLASALATTGLTNGSIYVGGVQDGKFLLPCDFDFDLHYDEYSPDEFRGSFDRDFELLQLRHLVTVSKLDMDFYPDSTLLYWHHITDATPTVTTLPASPTVLKASTAVAGGPLSLTTQPTNPGMKLQVVTTGVGALGTVVFTGTDINGLAQTETLNIPNTAAGTYYSAFVYASVGASGVAFTGLTGGSVAINGVFGFKWVFTPDGNVPLTGALSFFTGTDSGVLPFFAMEDVTLDYSPDKAARLTGKGIAQDWCPIGDRTTLNRSSSRITSLGQPTDAPFVGTESQMWIDPVGGTVGTTLYTDALINKIDFKWPVAGKWMLILSQVFNRIRRMKRETTANITIDFTNELQAEAYRKAARQYYQFQMIGKNIGGGNQKSFTFQGAAKIETFVRKPGVAVDTVEADVALRFLYDSTLGASYIISIVNQTAPTYLS